MSEKRHGTGFGVLQVCIAGVLWGTGGLVATALHRRDGMDPMVVTAWRIFIASLALLAFSRMRHRFMTVWGTLRRHPGLVASIGFGTVVVQGAFFVAVLQIGVSISTVIALAMAPIMASAIEHVLTGTRPSLREIVIQVVAIAGLALITFTAGEGTVPPGGNPVLGIGLSALSGGAYAVTTVIGHDLAQKVDSIALTASSTCVGALVLLPFMGFMVARGAPVLPGSAVSGLLIVYVGMFTMALAYLLLYDGLRTTSGSAATVATLIEPVAAAVLAMLLLGERLSWLSVVGGLMILGAVVALQRREENPAPL